MENTINERIRSIVEKLGYKSKRSFALKIGVSQTSLNDVINGAEPKFGTLNKIVKAEPLISTDWLLTGEGDMLKSQTISESNIDYKEKYYNSLEEENKLRKEKEEMRNEIDRLRAENEFLKKGSIQEGEARKQTVTNIENL